MISRCNKRWAVEAVFSDGSRVVLRYFHVLSVAQDWLELHEHRDYYPERIYRLEIRPYEVLAGGETQPL